jgi:arginine decarboxylase
MIDEIINQIKIACDEAVRCAKHFTEFGSFTVGESGGAIYQILYQNNKMIEKWNMIDSSFITTLPTYQQTLYNASSKSLERYL